MSVLGRTEDLPTQAEHGVHVGSAEVEETVVEARVEFDLHGVQTPNGSGASARRSRHGCRQHS